MVFFLPANKSRRTEGSANDTNRFLYEKNRADPQAEPTHDRGADRFFEKNHYLMIPNALTGDEVRRINAAIDQNRKAFPGLWSTGNRMQSAQCCLLGMPELDFLVRHSSFFPIAAQALDGDIVFSEFAALIRAGNQKQGSIEGWHRDFAPNPAQRLGIRSLSAIYYLTDVDETTARYSLIPASQNVNEAPKKVREDGEDRCGEIEMLGPAGSVILVNAGIWHCGKWGHGPRERRTVHVYYQQSTTPAVSNHTIFPRRLWDVTDAGQRRFYSHFNPLTQVVVADYAK